MELTLQIQNLVILLITISMARADVTQDDYSVLCQNRMPPSTVVLSSDSGVTPIQCALYCHWSPSCRTFAFKEVTWECFLLKGIILFCDSLESEVGTNILTVDSTVLHFPMDEIVGDTLVGDINATLYNNPPLVPGIRGNALSFNGDGQWANYGLQPCFSDITQCSDGYSFAVWLKLGSSMSGVSEAYIISSGGQTNGADPGGMSVHAKSGLLEVRFRLRTANKLWMKTGITFTTNEWFHLAATWSEDQDLTVYVNGSALSTVNNGAYSPTSNVPSNMHVGKPNNGNVMYGEFTIDEWYFLPYILDRESVEMIYALY